jgi:alkyldihydroxyacetonephosphate synthase
MTSANDEKVTIDLASLLVEVPASKTLDAVETELAARGLTLGVAMEVATGSSPIGAWLAKGAPGAASLFSDPADHLVAGLLATLSNGSRLEVRPGPRRAVGPDLTALAVGTNGRLATIERAWLRVHHRDARRQVLPLPEGVDLDPPVSADERRLLDAIERELLHAKTAKTA